MPFFDILDLEDTREGSRTFGQQRKAQLFLNKIANSHCHKKKGKEKHVNLQEGACEKHLRPITEFIKKIRELKEK